MYEAGRGFSFVDLDSDHDAERTNPERRIRLPHPRTKGAPPTLTLKLGLLIGDTRELQSIDGGAVAQSVHLEKTAAHCLNSEKLLAR